MSRNNNGTAPGAAPRAGGAGRPAVVVSGAGSPLATAIRVSVASSRTFANKGTTLVSLLLMPLLELALFVVIAISAGSTQVRVSAYAAVLVGACVSIMAAIVGSVTRDRQMHVLLDALRGRTFRATYWIGKAVVPVLTSAVVAAVMAAGVFALDPEHLWAALAWTLLLLIPALLVGVLAGIAVGTASIGFKDPYLLSNIMGLVIPVTAGVMAPVALYPVWLAVISWVMPMTGLIGALRAGMSAAPGVPGHVGAGYDAAAHPALAVWAGLGHELVVDVLWLAVGIALTRLVLRRIYAGKRSEEIW